MNDSLAVGHRIAGKIAQAVWGSNYFKQPIARFNLAEEKDDNVRRNEKVFRTLRAKGLI